MYRMAAVSEVVRVLIERQIFFFKIIILCPLVPWSLCGTPIKYISPCPILCRADGAFVCAEGDYSDSSGGGGRDEHRGLLERCGRRWVRVRQDRRGRR